MTDLRWVPAQTFTMGSDRHHAEEAPARPASVDGFWIERHPVTNAQFAAFVRDTGYRTVAERPLDPADFPGAPPENLVPGSMVFTGTPGPVDLRHLAQWWAWTPGALWRRPEGRGSSLAQRADHPVVHVAHEDAAAYATWAGRALPTETEWEAAARGGLDGAAYTWGDEPRDGMANHWHGAFPWRAERGYGATTPVGTFPPNGYDLVDMAGNVWEWTADRWDGAAEPSHVVKGGSFLCADEYCSRYRPAARRPQPVDTGMSHLGFRCVVRDQLPGGGA
ncbi:formylglycine-generating enzyme required for sulfatase activity [Actinomycetospora succinea]|uniref:Formylglycine-generating enzyme required for sulfatase activity n=1 Tax=Actinomycetospora succinea TaxID=663603 RepID=A0A4R6UHQ0_9PSEU|nr:formylglycine-generating enzyme family protein [Actinomycetospora succinea]TDQ46400.1 formylglycine-generating enzyme required for sulfatase activity [Actinomycetospora succinea]